MKSDSKEPAVAHEGAGPSAERRLEELGIKLPAPPEPFGTYVEAVQTDHLLLLSGMLFPRREAVRRSSDGSERSSTSTRDGRRPTSPRSTFSRSRGATWDRSTR
jgi:hypothetical protein